MKRLVDIVFVSMIIIVVLAISTVDNKAVSNKPIQTYQEILEQAVKGVNIAEKDYFLMTITAYSLHPDCIAEKYNDGLTATGTPIREGVAAINVDRVDGRWLVKSPLELGHKIYIEGMGEYVCEDTGYFTDVDFKQDYWNVDVYMEDHNKAVEFGRQLKRVYVLVEE